MTKNLVSRRWSTSQWEAHIGDQVRRARAEDDLSQAELAERANISRNSVSSLERGEGSSLATLIRVVRALGRADWLDDLAPETGPSPLELLRQQQSRTPKRVRSPRAASQGA